MLHNSNRQKRLRSIHIAAIQSPGGLVSILHSYDTEMLHALSTMGRNVIHPS